MRCLALMCAVCFACGASESTGANAPCPSSTTSSDAAPLVDATAIIDAIVSAPDATDAGVVDAAALVAQALDARDLFVAQMASMPLKTIPSPTPPPPEPKRPTRSGMSDHHIEVPRVYESAFRISEGLPFEVVRRIMRQNYGRMRLCYQNALRDGLSTKVKLVTRIAIDKHGELAISEPLTSDAPAAMTLCYTHAFRGLSFPEPDQPLVVVEYGMTFEP